MKKYNLSDIMNRAWSIRRMNGRIECSMSTALRQAWAEAKRPSYDIKRWFLEKNFSRNELFAMDGVDPALCGETEKAVKLMWRTDYGKIIRWIPKSCLMTDEDLAHDAAIAAAAAEDWKRRQARYNDLIAECRIHGIPARKGWRVATMKEKLAAVVA